MAQQRKFRPTLLFDIGIEFQKLEAYYRNQPVDEPDSFVTGDPVIDRLQKIVSMILPITDYVDNYIEDGENQLLEDYFDAYQDADPDYYCRNLYATIFETISAAPISLLPTDMEFAHDHLINRRKQPRIFRQINGDSRKILPRLPVSAQRDFREAFRCYAHGLYYASETLVWRAVEETVRVYYGKICGKQNISRAKWADIVSELKEVLVTNEEKNLIERIDRARVSRNEVAHSGEDVSERSAKHALRESVRVVSRVVEDLEKRGLLE